MTKTMRCLIKRTRGVSFAEWLVLGTWFGDLLRKEQLLFHFKKGAWGGQKALSGYVPKEFKAHIKLKVDPKLDP